MNCAARLILRNAKKGARLVWTLVIAVAAAWPCTQLEQIRALEKLAVSYFSAGQFWKAEQLREQLEACYSDEIRQQLNGSASVPNLIATLEHARHNNEKARNYYSEALWLLRKSQGPTSADAGVVESNLGTLELEAGHYALAAELFQQSVHEIEITAGLLDPRLVQPLVNLSFCRIRLKDARTAEELARRAVQIASGSGEKALTAVIAAQLQQARALSVQGHKKQARELEREANGRLKSSFDERLRLYTIGIRELSRSERSR